MINGALYINGKKYDGEEMNAKEVTIHIEGDVGAVKLDAGVLTINGLVTGGVETVNGNIEISGDVNGGVETVNGNVRCGHVGASVSSLNGNIRHT